jgi:hypothetical protein
MHIRTEKLFVILVFLMLAVGLAACGGSTEEEPAEQEVAPTQVEEAAPTQAEQQEEPATPVVESAPTEAAPSIKELPEVVMNYFTGTPVSYFVISDYDQSWAQIGWGQYTSIEDPPTNFVIRTDANWSSASDTANWDQSGCGFVFHAKDTSNLFISYLGLDGSVYVQRLYNGENKILGSVNYGKVDIPEGSAEIMLMVNGDKIYFFVNGEEVYSGSDSLLTGALDSGDLAFILMSGTNKDFGTRCQMKNTDLWDLGK